MESNTIDQVASTSNEVDVTGNSVTQNTDSIAEQNVISPDDVPLSFPLFPLFPREVKDMIFKEIILAGNSADSNAMYEALKISVADHRSFHDVGFHCNGFDVLPDRHPHDLESLGNCELGLKVNIWFQSKKIDLDTSRLSRMIHYFDYFGRNCQTFAVVPRLENTGIFSRTDVTSVHLNFNRVSHLVEANGFVYQLFHGIVNYEDRHMVDKHPHNGLKTLQKIELSLMLGVICGETDYENSQRMVKRIDKALGVESKVHLKEAVMYGFETTVKTWIWTAAKGTVLAWNIQEDDDDQNEFLKEEYMDNDPYTIPDVHLFPVVLHEPGWNFGPLFVNY